MRIERVGAIVRPVLISSLLFFAVACSPSEAELAATDSSHSGNSNEDSGELAGDTATSEDSGEQEETGETGNTAGAEWTFLVYMNGDNDLEPWALADVNEMEAVGSSDRINIVIQLDRSPDYATEDGDWTTARRYRVEADTATKAIGSPVLADLGEVDSGDPTVIADFARWGIETFPAERYALVLWDHGTGWNLREGERTKGISDDYTSRSELSVADGDLQVVLAEATAAAGGKLELVGFDACTMQMWEVAWSVAPYAQTLVASQDYEALTGWAYDAFLADLAANPAMPADELARAIALRFHEIPDSTQSVLNLDVLPAFSVALDGVADAVVASGYPAETLWTAASGAQGFDGPNSWEHDAEDLLERIAAASSDAAVDAAVERALVELVPVVVASYNQGGSVKNARGLSIFSPADGYLPPMYANAPWAADSRWDEFIAEASARK